ncbi:unnamed protein product [Rangifer tarandus platyrhynchus]|uniref:Uncharacterized protein n=1 Tax=Rangifer tarandus platyrhynchus TaxID=3082113 RepID=A0AC59YAY7_RANTA
MDALQWEMGPPGPMHAQVGGGSACRCAAGQEAGGVRQLGWPGALGRPGVLGHVSWPGPWSRAICEQKCVQVDVSLSTVSPALGHEHGVRSVSTGVGGAACGPRASPHLGPCGQQPSGAQRHPGCCQPDSRAQHEPAAALGEGGVVSRTIAQSLDGARRRPTSVCHLPASQQQGTELQHLFSNDDETGIN